jgi:hypothetical protein
MIQARRGGQREVRYNHPRVFSKNRPAVTGDFTHRGDAGRLLVRNTEGVIQLIAREVYA